MNLQIEQETLPEVARDLKLNLNLIRQPEATPHLTPQQKMGILLAASYALGQKPLLTFLQAEAVEPLSAPLIEAAQKSVLTMAMNNVYYRSQHLIDDVELSHLPAGLRMQALSRPPIDKTDFELMNFAVSALSGCGMCLKSHYAELKKAGVRLEALHETLKVVSVWKALSQWLIMKSNIADPSAYLGFGETSNASHLSI
jgi:alkyl hydroperoxide reductase subunit D